MNILRIKRGVNIIKMVVVMLLALHIAIVNAATPLVSNQYTLLAPLPCIQGGGVNCTSGQPITSINLNQYLAYAFNLFIALAAVAAVFMIVWGGFQYMTTDAWQGKKEGLDKFRNAIVGLLMILIAYLILKTVNPQLVNIPSTIVPNLNLSTASTTSTLAFFQDLQDQVDSYNASINQQAGVTSAQLQQNASDITTTKAAVSALQQQQATLEDQLETAQENNDPSQGVIEAQLASITQQINTQEANLSYDTAKNVMLAVLQNTQINAGSSPNSPALLENFGDTADQAYTNASTVLEGLGASTQKQDLDNLYYAVGAQLIIQQEVNINQTNHDPLAESNLIAKTTNTVTQNYLNNITDPTIKAQVQTDLNNAIQVIQAQNKLIQNNGN